MAAALVFSGAVAQTSTGLLTTAGAGNTLEFGSGAAVSNGTLTPNGGAVYVNSGSLTDVTVNDGNVSLNNATLVRTSLGLGSGTVNGSANYFQGSLTSRADLTLGNGASLYIQKDGANQPTITNNGTITLNPASGVYELPLCRQRPSHVQRQRQPGPGRERHGLSFRHHHRQPSSSTAHPIPSRARATIPRRWRIMGPSPPRAAP